MVEPAVTVTEVVIHPKGDPCNEGALILRLAPEGDYLILTHNVNEGSVELDAADLPVLLREGMRLLEQGNAS